MATLTMMYEHAIDDSSPGSPPDLSESKSSQSSSFNSLESDDNADLADVGNFEDITLDDNDRYDGVGRMTDHHPVKTMAVSPYSPAFPGDLRQLRRKTSTPRMHSMPRDLSSAHAHASRDVLAVPKNRPTLPSLQTQMHGVTVRTTSIGLQPHPRANPIPRRNQATRSTTSLNIIPPHRSKSPSLHLDPRDPKLMPRPRSSSWQSSGRRKSAFELELECDEDDGDVIPDGLVLDNVPISPRPPAERSKSQPVCKSASPEPRPKERLRSVGNGTPPVAVARGSLRSPQWKSDSAVSTLKSRGPSPLSIRAKSWTAALADLNADAKDLTEKLEEHADEIEHKAQRSSTGSMPNPRRSSDYHHHDTKPRVRSALPELPPLRRTNIMIDPLPISKEKEAVLSRTRPSWLPPKDPAEERRHLKEYQKMMARSVEAERRRDADRRARSEQRDQAADGLQHIWEQDILPRWDMAVRERRTRELWWHGVAPRSRGRVWSRAIGNELGLNETSYHAALRRAREVEARIKAGKESTEDAIQAGWFVEIRRDVEERTWRELRIFQPGAPLHQGLVDVLSAYAMYRSDIGYMAGCNTIAALLLLNLPSPASTFTALANVLNRPLPLSFHVADAGAKSSAYNLLLQTLSHKSPNLHSHLVGLPDHDPDSYLGDVFTSLFTSYLALDEAARLWDVYVFEGDAVLVRAGVALLVRREMALLGANSMDEVRAALAVQQTVAESKGLTVGENRFGSTEDRWIRAVREAGKT